MLYLRGAGGQGLVTLDGLPVPDSLPGVIHLNALLPDGLQYVEVSRGFGPASQPFSSHRGAIRMISRTALNNSGDLRIEGGTFGFLKETLRGNLANERAHLAITVTRSDAFDGAWHAQRSNNNPERDPFHDTQILTKAELDISDDINWEASLLYRKSRNGWDRYGIRRGVLAVVDDKHGFFAEEVWMVQSSVKAHLTDDWLTRLQLGYTQTRDRGRTMGLNLGYTTDFYLVRWENDQRLWRGESEDSVRLIWGGEGRHESASGPTYAPIGPFTFAAGTPFSEARSQQAGFLETRFAYGPLSGTVGVRYEAYDRFSNHALFQAGVAWKLLPTLKFRANGGNGFRIPSYAERLYPLLGNLAIQPERGAGGDVGLDWQPLSNLTLNLPRFYSRYDDFIIVTWNPQPRAQIP
ncbi:protein of unknown function [Methylocaldum szegediense]|uniref:TonB-dependent receptor-like beta-barrel domain-containing protein n=1 Tax=Methylocaldum szegediense TaxID=73780 RepID=A0ABN8WZ87_9GAMM|nr:protein of unknown function [Methylocaldum szegediense]